jgi:putative ABC transport system ATP-binding protein
LVASAGTPALVVRDLVKNYSSPEGVRRSVVDVAELTLQPGEQAALRGESGSGKTTLLHLVAGILQADAGEVRVAGIEMTALREAERDRARAEHVGYVFQTFNLLQGFTALENVLLAMAFGRGVDEGRAHELLRRVGLAERVDYIPSRLSVGQQQRVAVARALANRPSLVLADEPTGSLDPARAAEALALLRETCRESGAALLVASHDRDVLAQFGTVYDIDRLSGRVERSDPASSRSTRGD